MNLQAASENVYNNLQEKQIQNFHLLFLPSNLALTPITRQNIEVSIILHLKTNLIPI